MRACQVHEQAIKRRPLYALACCLMLSLAAAPSQAAARARHRARNRAAPVTFRPHKGLFPDTRTDDVGSYRVHYVRPSKTGPASIVVSMHLDAYDDIRDGSGRFHKHTPSGNVLVKWQRKHVQLLGRDEYGGPVDSEFSVFPVYTLTIDSPKALAVSLITQQHGILALRLNGTTIQPGPYLTGEIDRGGMSDAVHFNYTFPGGHNVLYLRMAYFRME